MDNQGFAPLNNCSNGCCGNHQKAHKEESDYKCCNGKHADGHKYEGCHCNHK